MLAGLRRLAARAPVGRAPADRVALERRPAARAGAAALAGGHEAAGVHAAVADGVADRRPQRRGAAGRAPRPTARPRPGAARASRATASRRRAGCRRPRSRPGRAAAPSAPSCRGRRARGRRRDRPRRRPARRARSPGRSPRGRAAACRAAPSGRRRRTRARSGPSAAAPPPRRPRSGPPSRDAARGRGRRRSRPTGTSRAGAPASAGGRSARRRSRPAGAGGRRRCRGRRRRRSRGPARARSAVARARPREARASAQATGRSALLDDLGADLDRTVPLAAPPGRGARAAGEPAAAQLGDRAARPCAGATAGAQHLPPPNAAAPRPVRRRASHGATLPPRGGSALADVPRDVLNAMSRSGPAERCGCRSSLPQGGPEMPHHRARHTPLGRWSSCVVSLRMARRSPRPRPGRTSRARPSGTWVDRWRAGQL